MSIGVPAAAMLAGTALSAGGSLLSGMNSQARVGAVNAGRDRVMRDEMARQEGFAREAQPIFADHLATRGAEGEAGQRETAIAARNASIEANQKTPVLTMGGMGDYGSSEYQRQAANLGQIITDNAKRAAVLSSYGDAAAENSRAFRKASDRIGTISNFATGSANVLPAEFSSSDANAYRNNPPSPFADLLKAAGAGAAMYGMFQPSPIKYNSIDDLMRAQKIGGY